MVDENFQSPFSKSLLTGLFLGIAATIACLFFGIIYRSITGFGLTSYMNVPTDIFVCNIVLTLFGILHYYVAKSFKGGTIVYIVGFTLLTIVGIWRIGTIQRSDIPGVSRQFHGMLSGMVLIIAIGAILIPILVRSKKFQKGII